MIRPSGPCPSKIMIVGEMPGDQEVLKGYPFEGTAGDELSKMLADVGILRSTCMITSVLRVKLPGGLEDAMPERKRDVNPERHVTLGGVSVHKEVLGGIELLKREIELCQPNVIIALGSLALWALTGKTGIQDWRGSELQTSLTLQMGYRPKVIPTYSPSMVLRVWKTRPIVLQDLRRAKRESLSPELLIPKYDFLVDPQLSQVRFILHSILKQADQSEGKMPLAVDIETRAYRIACVGIAWSKLNAMCVPFLCTKGNGLYWSLEEETEIIKLFRQVLTHPNIEIIGQNFQFDSQYFYRYWSVIPENVFDTMIAQHVCFSGMDKSLHYMSSMYCEHHVYWKDEGKEWNPSMDEEQYWLYNCKDCTATFEIAEMLKGIVRAFKLEEVNAFQQKLFYPVLKTMLRGLLVDKAEKARMSSTMAKELKQRELWLNSIVGEPLNIRSTPQMQNFFYGVMRQRPVKARGKDAISCNDEALRKIASREPLLKPIINKVSEMRSIGVFLGTFLNSQLDIDGRMRCQYKITGTETYRFASSKNAFGSGLNLQNIPSGGEEEDGLELPNVRTLFIPEEGQEFFDIDLSSADLRIVVWESDCKEMKAMLREGYDPYTVIAQEFYNDKSITKKDPRRQTFKGFAHGTNYLGTAKGLAERFGLSVHEAERTQKWYFDRFSEIKKWHDHLRDQIFKRKYIKNPFGYRFNIIDRIDQSTMNAAAAWIPQSTVACLINRAYELIDRTMPEVRILLQVHDSLGGEYPISKAEHYRQAIVKAAEIALPYPGDPLVIPVGIKVSQKSWGDCK